MAIGACDYEYINTSYKYKYLSYEYKYLSYEYMYLSYEYMYLNYSNRQKLNEKEYQILFSIDII